jgi:hypothetical protein
MLMLLMETVCLVGRDMDGDAARNGPVELCRHGSVALGPLVAGFQAEAEWNWSKAAGKGRLSVRRKVFIRQARPPLS